MIIKTYEVTIDEIIEKYRKEAYDNSADISNYVWNFDKKLKKNTGERNTKEYFVKLDDYVDRIIKENNFAEGMVICSSQHTTSGIFVNHFEEGLLYDLLTHLDYTYPSDKPNKYKHNIWDCEYKNAHAHLKAISLSKSATIIVKDGQLILGDFENIIYAEFDFRPQKSISITLIGNGGSKNGDE